MIYEYILLIFLVMLSAFFSGAEMALFSLSNIKLHQMIDKNVKNAKLVFELKSNPNKLLITLLLCNNLVNVSASAISTVIAIRLFGSIGLGIATGVMTFILLVFGEITPKVISVMYNDKISVYSAKPIKFLSIALFPLIYIFESSLKILTHFTKNTENILYRTSHEEIKTIVSLGADEGVIGNQEKKMIYGVLKLAQKDVYQVMVPRNRVFSLEMNKRVSKVMDEVIISGYSRIPVYDKKVLNIKGMVYIKDILAEINKKRNPKLSKIMRIPLIVPELKKIDDLLSEFKKKKVHMALVVNEHGDISGVVTIEDLIEEIVGEIYDETDSEEPTIQKLNDKSCIVFGQTSIDKIQEYLGMNMKFVGQDYFETFNGLIVNKTGKIPKEGERINFKHFYVDILESDNRKIIKAKIIIKSKHK